MIQNVARKVKHYRLSKVKAYYAIFEAISNSIDSFNGDYKNAHIDVSFIKDNSGLDFGSDNQEIRTFKKVIVKDNGEGFTDKNFQSFNTSDSDFKESIGGKGLGRFSWLKAFESVAVESTFFDSDSMKIRTFSFMRTPDGIHEHNVTTSPSERTGTIVTLLTQKKDWEIPKKIKTFTEKLIEHFLPVFLKASQPNIRIHDADTDETIDANQYFTENYKGLVSNIQIEVSKKVFNISIHKTKIGNNHQLIYIANNRASKIINLSKYIIDLNAELFDDDGKFYIIAFITSDYLDDTVVPERDDFTFEFDSSDEDLNFLELNQKVVSEIKVAISELLLAVQQKKRLMLDEYVSSKGPEYRYLLNKSPEVINTISPIANETEIESCLHKAEIEFKENTEKEIKLVLSSAEVNIQEIDAVYEKVSEAAKADLTKCILWRSHVITLLEKKMAWDKDQRFDKEDELHKLFFQMRVSSDDTPYETNNLWLIDERLNFHDYLASDLPLDGKKGDRPDIFSYNVPHYFNNQESPSESFSIIEFKRPMRDDYTLEENPIDQVTSYIEQIREKKAKRKDGQLILLSENTPCFAFIICDLTQKLRSICKQRGYISTYDELGYFFYNSVYNTYIEVLSYQHVAKEAKNRNRIFMKKIGI